MNMTLRFLTGLLCLVAIPASALETVTLQLKWTHQFQFAGYYVAQEKGYYQEAGLAVNIIEAAPNTDPVAEVLSGNADFGVGSSSLLLERSAGKPLLVLAVIFQHSPYVILARQQSAVQSIHDIAGERLMMEPLAYELMAYLKKESLAINELTLTARNPDVHDLITGQIDVISAYITDEPYFLDEAKFTYQLYSPRSAGIDFYGDNLFTSEQQVADYPGRVKAFREASLKGWRYAMSHPEETVELILARYSQKKTRAHLLYEARQMQSLMFPELIEIGYMFPGRWQHIAETYADLNLLPKDFALAGFLYNPNPYPLSAFIWLFAIVMSALIVIFIVSHVALRYFRLSNKLDKLLYIKNYHANIGESVNTISHQWKQPLNELGIQIMLIESIMEKSPVNENTAEIQRITDKSHDILEFMANTVDVFRNFLSTNNTVSHFNPALVIRETLQLVIENFQDNAITLSFDCDQDTRITANSTEFAHVILSILVNAKDVLLEREIAEPIIKIHLFVINNTVQITIADNAGGIKATPVDKIFQLGFSTKTNAKSGIGLYVARKIIKEKMFGTLSAENNEQGAVFKLCIPAYAT